MKRILIGASLALALGGCTFTTDGLNTLGSLPPPAAVTGMNKTLIDDKAVGVAYVALDTATTLVDLAVQAGKIVPRSATALRVANALDIARNAVNAAADAQAAGQATDYATAITRATAAIAEVRAAIQGAKS